MKKLLQATLIGSLICSCSASPLAAAARRAEGADDSKCIYARAAQRSFFLPGWGQWSKGYRAKGVLIGMLEAGAITGAVVSYQQAKQAETEFRNGTGLYSAHTGKIDQGNYFLAAAALIWGYGIFDAYVGTPAPGVSASIEGRDTVIIAYRTRF